MDETARIGLPLVQAAQSQKHVTVNAALTRLDALLPLVIEARDRQSPPGVAEDGQVWAVPAGAGGDWAGQAGNLALAVNGGWEFVTPARGWRAFVLSEGQRAVHDGTDWRAGMVNLSPSGAGLVAGLVEGEHVITGGTSSVTTVEIPARVSVLGVTARVLEPITGTLSAWRIGTSGAADRFGSGLGLAAGSTGNGILGWPMTYYSVAPLILSAQGGSFSGGRVRLAVHYLALAVPTG